jgi:hypothetical protein
MPKKEPSCKTTSEITEEHRGIKDYFDPRPRIDMLVESFEVCVESANGLSSSYSEDEIRDLKRVLKSRKKLLEGDRDVLRALWEEYKLLEKDTRERTRNRKNVPAESVKGTRSPTGVETSTNYGKGRDIEEVENDTRDMRNAGNSMMKGPMELLYSLLDETDEFTDVKAVQEEFRKTYNEARGASKRFLAYFKFRVAEMKGLEGSDPKEKTKTN